MSSNIEQNWARRTRFLTQALIISGALNMGLIATFITLNLQKKQASIAFEMTPSALNSEDKNSLNSNENVLTHFSNLSFAELVELLEDQNFVEEGCKRRDLALASLATFHFFNVEKALSNSKLQKRQLSFYPLNRAEKVDVSIFRGLTDEHFHAVKHYAETEKWPLTSEGLFVEIQRTKTPRESSLVETFYLTPEFHSLSILFNRAKVPLQKAGIIELIAQGNWQILQSFTAEQKMAQDLSPDRLKMLLMSYVKQHSILAAQILTAWDREFIRLKLEDKDLTLLLDLIVTKTPGLDALLKDLFLSQRSDEIWKKAAEKLYAFAGKSISEPYDHQQTLLEFFPDRPHSPKPLATCLDTVKSEKSSGVYVVQPGDNLWKIAKKHRVSIESIKQKNHLEGEKLKVGKELIIY